MSDTKHSPLPWSVKECGTKDCWCRVVMPASETAQGSVISAGSVFERDAEFIVRACNSHYELVEALDSAIFLLAREIDMNPEECVGGDFAQLRAALAKATKGQ